MPSALLKSSTCTTTFRTVETTGKHRLTTRTTRKKCAICGSSEHELIMFEDLPVCINCKAGYVQSLAEGVSLLAPDGVHGDAVVVRRGDDLPARCVHCNRPADGRRKVLRFSHRITLKQAREESWWWAWFTGVSGSIGYSICSRHRKRYWIGVALRCLTICSIVGACVVVGVGQEVLFWILLGSALISGLGSGRFIRKLEVARVSKEWIWVTGVCQEFRDSERQDQLG